MMLMESINAYFILMMQGSSISRNVENRVQAQSSFASRCTSEKMLRISKLAKKD
jgi:hypothetical protein